MSLLRKYFIGFLQEFLQKLFYRFLQKVFKKFIWELINGKLFELCYYALYNKKKYCSWNFLYYLPSRSHRKSLGFVLGIHLEITSYFQWCFEKKAIKLSSCHFACNCTRSNFFPTCFLEIPTRMYSWFFNKCLEFPIFSGYDFPENGK